jgi:N-methylhydantoinase B
MTTTDASRSSAAHHDPISLQIIRHELVAIPNQIEKNIERTAFSPLVQEYKDYSVGFVDPDGRLVAQSRGSLPIFVANALGAAVREGISVYGTDGLADGDIVISNTAEVLGQHLNNAAAYTPVRIGEDLVGFFAVLVHWIDVGGAVPGSCGSTTTTDVWQEGVQYPAVKLIERGTRREDIFRMIAVNSRFPKLLLGDLEAQLGGCVMGRDMLVQVASRHGVPAIRAAIDTMWQDADAAIGRVLEKIPPGIYTADALLDDDGVRTGTPVRVEARIEIGGGRMKIDLSGCADQVTGPFNAGRNGGAVAASRIAFKYLLAPDTPVNEGDFTRLDVEIPDGKFLSARPDAPIGGSGAMIPTVVDTILRAMGAAMPERAVAAHHGIYGVHSLVGMSTKTGERFFNLDTVTGGWGASATTDGPGPFRSNAHGDVPDVPAEMQEALYPYYLEAKELVTDTGGPGRNRGGVSVEKRYRFSEPCRVMAKFDRTVCPPWGLHGGGEGSQGYVEVTRADGRQVKLLKGELDLSPGDLLRVRSGGGGGFGSAFDRDASSVRADVEAGYVSAEQARAVYGVVLRPDRTIDVSATNALRSAKRDAGLRLEQAG